MLSPFSPRATVEITGINPGTATITALTEDVGFKAHDQITEKQINEEKVDANVLVDLGKLCGIDFMKIEPLEKEE